MTSLLITRHSSLINEAKRMLNSFIQNQPLIAKEINEPVPNFPC